jgi:hypothetical protein
MIARPTLLLLLALCAAWLAGCSDRAAKQQAIERDNIRTLARLYGQYMSAHRGKSPASEVDFKKYIQSRKDELAAEQITDIDSLFVSNRDNQPYTVVYNMPPAGSMTPTGRVVAYEKQGVDGKRMVAYELMSVEELDEARFKTVVGK